MKACINFDVVVGYANDLVLYYPLFITAYLCQDYLDVHSNFQSNTLLLSSSSSKTSIGIAFMAKSKGRTVVGLTSQKNLKFVEGVGVYDVVVTYEDLEQWMDKLRKNGEGGETFVYVDVAGSTSLRASLEKGLTSTRLLKILPLGMRYHISFLFSMNSL